MLGGSPTNTNGPNGPSGNAPTAATADVRHTYTIPGIVQFLQYEWQRFELHRQQWEVSTIFLSMNVNSIKA